MGNRHTVTKRKLNHHIRALTENETKASSVLSSTNTSQILTLTLKPSLQKEENISLFTHIFKWENGGKEVYLSGSFCNWKTNYKMEKTDDKTYMLKLDVPNKGVFQYKYFVDNIWLYSDKEPICTDGRGNINNILDVDQINFSKENFVSSLDKAVNVCLKRRGLPDMYMFNKKRKRTKKTNEFPLVFNEHLMLRNCIKNSKIEELSCSFRVRHKVCRMIYYKPAKV